MSRLCTPPRHLHSNYASDSAVYFVTFCVWDRQPVFAQPSQAKLLRETLLDYRERGWFWILAYCIMPDHVHLLLKLRTSDRHLSTVVTALKVESVKRLRRSGVSVRWQYGYHDRILRYGESELAFAQYITLNPVRAGIVEEGEVYEFAAIVDRF